MRFFQGLERAGREASSVLLGTLAPVRKTSLPELRAALERGEIRKILLVRNYQGMGDLLCATPVIAALKSALPKVSIHFLANTFNQAGLKNNPALDKIWAWDERRKADPRQWLYFRTRLRQEHFDLALVLSGNALSLTAILLAGFSGARWVTGYETHPYGATWGQRLYSCEVPMPPATREIDKYAGLAEGVGIPVRDRAPKFFISPDQAAIADTFWATELAAAKRPVIGIFLGGKVDRPDRIWPPDYYARVARSLQEKTGGTILAIAPPLQSAAAQHRRESTFWMDEAVHVRDFLKTYDKACPVFRHADLGTVGAVLRKLDLFICPDGGMMHLAAALEVPALTLFFGTDPEIWHPPVVSSTYLRAPGNDPRALTPETVAQKALDRLSAVSGRR